MTASDASPHLRISRSDTRNAYGSDVEPLAVIDAGALVTFETWDARSGALLDRPPGEPYTLPRPDPARANPISGPVAVRGADPGDALVVDIVDVRCGPVGWCGAHAHVGPLPAGRIAEPIGRTCRVEDGIVHFANDIRLVARPMVGCIGVAPAGEPVPTAYSGRHGGNLDQAVVGQGAQVLLPVAVRGALLSLGDMHARQGDGELSGVGLEIPGEIDVRVHLLADAAPEWPWVRTTEGCSVMTVAGSFVEARAFAVEAAMVEIQRCLGLKPADAVALLSIAGDLRIGGAFGGEQVNVRLEIPTELGVAPAAFQRLDSDE